MFRQALAASAERGCCSPAGAMAAAVRAPSAASVGALHTSASRSMASISLDSVKPAAPTGPRLPQPSLLMSDLRGNEGASKLRKRKGRGEGSGMGKTAGRGMKGNTARSGGAVALGFEGGQTPLWRRTPKIGYMNKLFQAPLEVVNLGKLQLWIDQGRVDAGAPITMKTLVDAGLVSTCEYGVKLLAEGSERFAAKVDIEVSQASGGAIAAVEAAGGKVKSVYYSPLALRSLLKPHKFALPLMSPRPPPKKMGYYTDYANRGYLSPEVQLAEVKARLAAGMPHEQAAAVIPVYVGGPVEKGPALRAVHELR